jgi:DMSO/TMAO reductase YedYZ molybdopterin-dependent catalytic subunit
MSRRLTNALLLVAVATLVSTGLVAWLLPESQATPLYDLHRIAGAGLLIALPWKELIARSSIARRVRRRIVLSAVPGVLATIALALTLLLGVAWTVGLVSFDRPISYSAMNLHVFAGIALLPLAAWHLVQRWERPRVRDIADRRAAVRLVALGAAAAIVGSFAERVPAGRRVTGSRHAGSFSGNAFPVTIWSFDQVPSIDPATWRLELRGVSDTRPVALSDLAALPRHEVTAIIDCTGGWWSEQRWHGVSVRELLASRGVVDPARTVTVGSVTGHSWSFTVSELDDAILATHVGEEPLSAGHGAPVRLVVPGRRGYQWIKWVGHIAVDA